MQWKYLKILRQFTQNINLHFYFSSSRFHELFPSGQKLFSCSATLSPSVLERVNYVKTSKVFFFPPGDGNVFSRLFENVLDS
jgi:hypothetical protein